LFLSYIIYAAFIGVILYRLYFDYQKKRPRSIGEYIQRNVRPLMVLVIIGISYLTVTYVIGDNPIDKSQDYYFYEEKHLEGLDRSESQEAGIFSGDRNPNLLYDYIHSKNGRPLKLNPIRDVLELDLQSTNPEIRDRAVIFIYAIDVQLNKLPKIAKSLDLVQNRNAPYLNFYYGEFQSSLFQINDAIGYFKSEIIANGASQKAAKQIIDLTWSYFNEEFSALYYDKHVAPYMYTPDRFEFYFTNGDWGWYLNCYIERYTSTVNFLGFLAALVITLLWMSYIRGFDIFQREKWLPLITTFLLACGMLFFVYPISDLLNIYGGLRFHESAIGDFIYSVVAIGAVEELVKFLPWLIILKLTKQINEPFDYILYACFAALGFAFMENLKYYQESELDIISGRAITAVVSHMFDASVVAYAFIIAKYRVTKRPIKILIQLAGFAIAAFFHGFYDFWLISEFGQNLSVVTLLFMLGSLRVWMLMKNNALNLSAATGKGQRLNHTTIGDRLILGLVIIIMMEYVILATEHGSAGAGRTLSSNMGLVILVGVYLMLEMSNIKIRKGVWRKITIRDFVPRMNFRSDQIEDDDVLDDINILRFFSPKSNPHVGTQFPLVATFDRYVTLNNKSWPVYRFDKSIVINQYQIEYGVVRVKNKKEQLNVDKVEVIILFPRTEADLYNLDLEATDLMFVGALYSRPV
jgi:RsiW-degrading membrane proteinase PrsW (M82 family)